MRFKKVKFVGMVLSLKLLTGCAGFNSELQCPYQPGVGCQSLSAVSQQWRQGMGVQQAPRYQNKSMKPQKAREREVAQPLSLPFSEDKPSELHEASTLSKKTEGVEEPFPLERTNIALPRRHLKGKLLPHWPRQLGHFFKSFFESRSPSHPSVTLQALRALNEREESLVLSTEALSLKAGDRKTALHFPPSGLLEKPLSRERAEMNGAKSRDEDRLKKTAQEMLAKNGVHSIKATPRLRLLSRSYIVEQENEAQALLYLEAPKRTREKIITVVVGPYVDKAGDHHSVEIIHHVLGASHWSRAP